jgi:hypothetical protein
MEAASASDESTSCRGGMKPARVVSIPYLCRWIGCYTIDMVTPPSSTEQPHLQKARLLRWAALLLASILLHLIAFNWADGRIRMPSFGGQSPNVITTELRSVSPLPVPVAAAPPERVAKPRKPRTRPRRPNPPPQTSAAPVPEPVAEASEPLPSAGIEVPGTSVEPTTEVAAEQSAPADAASDAAATAAVPSAEDPPKPEEQVARYKVDPPPSVELKYDVVALQKGQNVYGRGKINWHSEGNSYTVTGEAAFIFFSVLNFKSEGVIDGSGVAPVIYSEKRFRKSETNTHFHRERNIISFSASTAAYPRKGGEQDRASIIWQLAAIGRGDSTAFASDTEIELFVAGVRDAETWRIRVIGEEEIEVGTGKVRAWHVVRIPRPGSYDQKLDIWFAPEQEWYPVKLRYTETNGDFLDMSLSNVHLVTAR